MNFFERIVYALQFEMERPVSYGPFHLAWLGASILLIVLLAVRKEKNHERCLKTILLVYGIGSLLLELIKQIIWSYNFDPGTGIGYWDYQWYAAPFQLCTTPIFTCLISAFLKKGRLRDTLLSYTAFVTVLGSVATAFYPEQCFVRTVMVDIHTMYLHFGSLVVSCYLLLSGEVPVRFRNLLKGYLVFLVFAAIALGLDLAIYHSGVLRGETFNMFYISPYFPSVLPVFDMLWQKLPYPAFLLLYLFAIFAGSALVWLIAWVCGRIGKRKAVRS